MTPWRNLPQKHTQRRTCQKRQQECCMHKKSFSVLVMWSIASINLFFWEVSHFWVATTRSAWLLVIQAIPRIWGNICHPWNSNHFQVGGFSENRIRTVEGTFFHSGDLIYTEIPLKKTKHKHGSLRKDITQKQSAFILANSEGAFVEIGEISAMDVDVYFFGGIPGSEGVRDINLLTRVVFRPPSKRFYPRLALEWHTTKPISYRIHAWYIYLHWQVFVTFWGWWKRDPFNGESWPPDFGWKAHELNHPAVDFY